MTKLCVFIGANLGRNPEYHKMTKQLGKEIAKRNIHLVYGGGKLGLMGVLADTVIASGGKVTGVITKSLYHEEAHLDLSELQMVDSMQERKKIMIQLADGLIACPGGLGTLEEIFEVWNAVKIKLHNKPIGLLNTDNYFNKLLDFIDYSVKENFLTVESRELIKINDDPSLLLDAITKHENKATLVEQHEVPPQEYVPMFRLLK